VAGAASDDLDRGQRQRQREGQQRLLRRFILASLSRTKLANVGILDPEIAEDSARSAVEFGLRHVCSSSISFNRRP
jgi:hypothetical protein